MLGNWQLANQGEDNLVRRSRSPSVISITTSMAAYQVKVKYGEERFRTLLIKDISFGKRMEAIKQNCSPLAHLPASNIRVRYRDKDSDMINLSEDPDDFAFGEMLRSAKEVKDRDYRKIFLQASEVDSPLPRKLRRMDVEMPSSSASNVFKSLQPKHLSFTPTCAPGAHLATTTAPKNIEKSPLDCQRQEMAENLQVLKVQIASAKEELEKVNSESRHFQSLSDIRARLCNNCHCSGHTKVKCSKPPCTDISVCKIIEKHPEHKTKIRSLENKAQEEETHLKGFTAARERAKSSCFFVMRPRLKAQNQVKYANRSRLDRDLMILQRVLKKVPDWCEDEDCKLPMIIDQYQNSNVNIYL